MAPRVLIVMRARWPRALLRAQLRERGYQAFAAPSLSAALPYVSRRHGGAPHLILADEQLLVGEEARAALAQLGNGVRPAVVLIARSGEALPEGEWSAVVERPVEPTRILRTVASLLPPPSMAAD